MSHITTIKTEVRDLDALKLACDRLDFEFMEGQTSYKWYGQWVGDTPMPEGVEEKDLGKCSHAIRVPGCKYEVGVVAENGGYRLAYDYYYSGGLEKKIGRNAGPIVQSYAIEKAKLEARRMGRVVLGEQQLQDGSVRLTIRGRV